MSDDLTGAHATGIHGDDLVVETGETALVFANQLRTEARLPVTRNVQLKFTAVCHHRLAAVAIALVAALIVAVEVMIHFGIQGPFGKGPFQIIQQTVRVEHCLRVRVSQKLVHKGI